MLKELPLKIRSAFNRLRWNSIFNLNLGIEKTDSAVRHWIYFPQKEFCFFRVGFLHNFSFGLVPPGKSSLYVEIAYSRNKPLDKNNIIARIKEDLRRVGLLVSADAVCAQDVNDIKYGYPIYDRNYRTAKEQIMGYLAHNDIIPSGRYGSWRYFSMEDAILDGRRAVNAILKDA